jgi:hypothetical protein
MCIAASQRPPMSTARPRRAVAAALSCRARAGLERLDQATFASVTRTAWPRRRLPSHLPPNAQAASMDLLLMPSQMVLQIHESIGHPLELDRILGDERNYAGLSFVTPEMFGRYRYGSPLTERHVRPWPCPTSWPAAPPMTKARAPSDSTDPRRHPRTPAWRRALAGALGTCRAPLMRAPAAGNARRSTA